MPITITPMTSMKYLLRFPQRTPPYNLTQRNSSSLGTCRSTLRDKYPQRSPRMSEWFPCTVLLRSSCVDLSWHDLAKAQIPEDVETFSRQLPLEASIRPPLQNVGGKRAIPGEDNRSGVENVDYQELLVVTIPAHYRRGCLLMPRPVSAGGEGSQT